MPDLSEKSIERLNTCHPDLVKVVMQAIKMIDFKVICGERNKQEQDIAFENGLSKQKWPNSKHNVLPFSTAIDLAPYPINWNDRNRFIFLAGCIMAIAHTMGIKMRWGGDWNSDGMFNDSFVDMPHFELVGK